MVTKAPEIRPVKSLTIINLLVQETSIMTHPLNNLNYSTLGGLIEEKGSSKHFDRTTQTHQDNNVEIIAKCKGKLMCEIY